MAEGILVARLSNTLVIICLYNFRKHDTARIDLEAEDTYG